MNTSIVRPTQLRAGSQKTQWIKRLVIHFKTSVFSALAALMLSMVSINAYAEPEIPDLIKRSARTEVRELRRTLA